MTGRIGPIHEVIPEKHNYYCDDCRYKHTNIKEYGPQCSVHYECHHPKAMKNMYIYWDDQHYITPEWCPYIRG